MKYIITESQLKLLIEQKAQRVIYDISKEGIKNLSPEMISKSQFPGKMFGGSFGGLFNGTMYTWLADGLNDIPLVQKMPNGKVVEGKILVGKNNFISKQTGIQAPNADPSGFYVGFISDTGFPRFVIYSTKDNEVNVLKF